MSAARLVLILYWRLESVPATILGCTVAACTSLSETRGKIMRLSILNRKLDKIYTLRIGSEKRVISVNLSMRTRYLNYRKESQFRAKSIIDRQMVFNTIKL
jgi:hypothetical protein